MVPAEARVASSDATRDGGLRAFGVHRRLCLVIGAFGIFCILIVFHVDELQPILELEPVPHVPLPPAQHRSVHRDAQRGGAHRLRAPYQFRRRVSIGEDVELKHFGSVAARPPDLLDRRRGLLRRAVGNRVRGARACGGALAVRVRRALHGDRRDENGSREVSQTERRDVRRHVHVGDVDHASRPDGDAAERGAVPS